MVTSAFTLKEISALPEFKDYGSIIIPSEGPMSEMTLKQFAAVSCWNAHSMADGYNRLLEIAEEGRKIYYPLWSKNEISEDSSLKERFLVSCCVGCVLCVL